MYALMYVCALMYMRTNSINYHEVWIGDMEERYGREVWNGSFKQVWNGGMERGYGTGIWNGGTEPGYGTGVAPDLVPDLIIWLVPTCLPKHHLDAARTDFQKSFPPTKRNKASKRIEFPNGVYGHGYVQNLYKLRNLYILIVQYN